MVRQKLGMGTLGASTMVVFIVLRGKSNLGRVRPRTSLVCRSPLGKLCSGKAPYGRVAPATTQAATVALRSEFFRYDAIGAHRRPQGFRNQDAAVSLLEI